MSGPVQIERGVPLPVRAGRKRRRPKYPLDRMQVGESFWAAVQPSALHQCIRRADLDGRRFTVRPEARDGKPGARCWRTA
jgi:hypothetical protein